MNLSGDEVKAQEEIENMCMTKRLEDKLELAETLKVLRYVAAEDHNPVLLEDNTA